MPTTKPRLYIVLAPQTDAALRTLASLHGSPISQVAASILDAAVPALEMSITALREADAGTGNAHRRVQRAVGKMVQRGRDLIDLAELEVQRKPPRKAGAATPRGGVSVSRQKRRSTPGL
jgi:hypothetical protein